MKIMILVSLLIATFNVSAKQYDVYGYDFSTEVICENGVKFLVVKNVKSISVTQIMIKSNNTSKIIPASC